MVPSVVSAVKLGKVSPKLRGMFYFCFFVVIQQELQCVQTWLVGVAEMGGAKLRALARVELTTCNFFRIYYENKDRDLLSLS